MIATVIIDLFLIKQLFTLCALVLLSLSLAGQRPQIMQLPQASKALKGTTTTQQLPAWCMTESPSNAGFYSTSYTIFQYDINGRTTDEILQLHQNSSGFENNLRTTTQYDTEGRLAEEVLFSWIGSTWSPIAKSVQKYDAMGSFVGLTNFSWNGIAWDTSYSQSQNLAYNSLNQVVHDTTSYWVNPGQGYAPYSLASYHYNNAGEIDTAVNFQYTGTAWDSTLLVFYEWYDFSQELASRIEAVSYWGNPSRELEEIDRTIPNVTQNTYSIWDSIAYVPEERNTFWIDQQGNPSFELYEEYVQNAWEFDGKDTFLNTYVNGDQLVEVVYQGYNSSTNQYENYKRNTYGDFFVSNEHSILREDFARLYPNPSQGQFKLRIDLEQPGMVSYTIWDLQGQKMAQGQLNHPGGEQVYELSDQLPPGTYLYTIGARGKQSRSKLIVR